MAGRGGQPSSRLTLEYLNFVQDMIHQCLLRYMNLPDAEEYLERHFQIRPALTRRIWMQLEEQHRDFFSSYHARRFDLILQQMQTENSGFPWPDSNSVPGDNISATISSPAVPNLQPVVRPSPNLIGAQRNIQPATASAPNLQPQVPLQCGLNVAPRYNMSAMISSPFVPNLQPDIPLSPDLSGIQPRFVPNLQSVVPLSPDLSSAQRNIRPATVPVPNLPPAVPLWPGDKVALTVPASVLPNLQPEPNIATRYNQAAMVPDPRPSNQQHQVPPSPASSNHPGDNQGLSRKELFRQYVESVKRVVQKKVIYLDSPQHGFHPSQAGPSNAPVTVAQNMGHGNTSASAFMGNVNVPGPNVLITSESGSIHRRRAIDRRRQRQQQQQQQQQQHQHQQQQQQQMNNAGLLTDVRKRLTYPDSLQHGFHPSQAGTSNAQPTMAQNMGYGNASASAGNVNVRGANVQIARGGGSIRGRRPNQCRRQWQQQQQQPEQEEQPGQEEQQPEQQEQQQQENNSELLIDLLMDQNSPPDLSAVMNSGSDPSPVNFSGSDSPPDIGDGFGRNKKQKG